ncbi:MAG: low molecular weight phosphotyrosine protein phosphatase [Chloroflexi bacterium]|nr:MAG: low molecular weight phosphotyrosine protein phosphatase [Chloroflexota bacterium]
MIGVLFVCLGNICRSPMAEGVFAHLVKEAGLDNVIYADSAGTGGWHVGESPHSGTQRVLREHGIAYHGRARQFTASDLNEFSYILAMDRSNLSGIRRLVRKDTSAEIALFLSYAYNKGLVDVEEVPDPYYDGRFDYVYELVHTGSQALLDHIRQAHNL